MRKVTKVCPAKEWPSIIKEQDIDCPSGLKFKDSGRLSELSRPGKQNISYRYRKEEYGEFLYLHNFRTGQGIVLQTTSPRKGSKDAKNIEVFFRGADGETQALYEQAAIHAKDLLESSHDATNEHPYLVKKNIPAFSGMKVDKDNNLLIPVRNGEGVVTSIQIIAPDGKKKNLANGRIKGGRYEFLSATNELKNIIVVSESVGSGASVNIATGYCTFCTFGTDNLGVIVAELRRLNPNARIIIAADNDCESSDNPGVMTATQVGMRNGCSIAIPEPIDGKSTDFSDVYLTYGADEVRRQIIESAEKNSFSKMPEGYFPSFSEGSWKLFVAAEKSVTLLGSMLYVSALGRQEDSSGWAYILEFLDLDGIHRIITIPAENINSDGSDWLASLTSNGYRCVAGCKSLLAKYITLCNPSQRVLIVRQVGWIGRAFVTSAKVYNQSWYSEPIRLITSVKGVMSQKGTLQGWQDTIGRLLHGNPIFQFAICVALAGPLLKLTPVGSGGFHFFGDSSCGKTTLLRLASSVWGSPLDMIRTWRSTDNVLEGVAEERNDGALFLDEIHQAETLKVAHIIYMLGNEMGKQRAGRDGRARRLSTWRLMLLSSGEKSVEGKLQELGKEYSAGQEVRLASIPVKQEDVCVLHGFNDSGSFVQAIEQFASEEYGTLGDAYLERLTNELDNVETTLSSMLADYTAHLLKEHPGCSSQVRRVALRYGLCLCAGGYASRWGLLSVAENELLQSVQSAFDRWIEARGGNSSNEKMRVLNTVRSFIEAHAISRFRLGNSEQDSIIHNCVGWRSLDLEYLFYPESFKKEVLKGYDINTACKYLREEGWLVVNEKGRNTCKRFIEGRYQRFYIIDLPFDDDNEHVRQPLLDFECMESLDDESCLDIPI